MAVGGWFGCLLHFVSKEGKALQIEGNRTSTGTLKSAETTGNRASFPPGARAPVDRPEPQPSSATGGSGEPLISRLRAHCRPSGEGRGRWRVSSSPRQRQGQGIRKGSPSTCPLSFIKPPGAQPRMRRSSTAGARAHARLGVTGVHHRQAGPHRSPTVHLRSRRFALQAPLLLTPEGEPPRPTRCSDTHTLTHTPAGHVEPLHTRLSFIIRLLL